ncbi:MNAT1 [Blepharisma stoltei]|uniref:RING-type domain-containing protein n=1 Tax=Blepharisma stoltei TaxID=1481888 RepID=A0AAU9I619_9CILI|nr:unnamed protein product [Blepharisma stoltei]
MDYMCPICLRDDRTPVIKLMFSVCGHQICEDCLKTLFRTETQINCPTCRRPLKRVDFSSRYLEEKEVDKENEIRREVLNVYNKLEDDFTDRESYDAYLEMIEDMIYEYISQKNSDIIKKKLDLERQNNIQEITQNESRKEEELRVMRENAVIEDSMFDESLKDRAKEIIWERAHKVEENLVSKEMPECKNFDSSYDLNTLDEELRNLFLNASGFDIDEIKRSSYQELIDGLNI